MWDVPENIQKVKERVEYVLSGCKCKTGCGTRRCKCRKSGRSCGPGCQCHGCVNVPNSPETDSLEDTVAVDVMRAESEQQEYMNESDEDSDAVKEDRTDND